MNPSINGWCAKFEGSVLHISGVAKFPNRFSTAGLERLKKEEAEVISYRLVFSRDKEPFCDADGIGPVHHFERDVSSRAQKICVTTDEGAHVFSIEHTS